VEKPDLSVSETLVYSGIVMTTLLRHDLMTLLLCDTSTPSERNNRQGGALRGDEMKTNQIIVSYGDTRALRRYL